jgi:hypothetical protein
MSAVGLYDIAIELLDRIGDAPATLENFFSQSFPTFCVTNTGSLNSSEEQSRAKYYNIISMLILFERMLFYGLHCPLKFSRSPNASKIAPLKARVASISARPWAHGATSCIWHKLSIYPGCEKSVKAAIQNLQMSERFYEGSVKGHSPLYMHYTLYVS